MAGSSALPGPARGFAEFGEQGIGKSVAIDLTEPGGSTRPRVGLTAWRLRGG
ncbi:hypothetical protein [Amycolatopsis sp. cmx-11-51]|uniref:hypothetical protein n=1 Tax=unclassified Amycolatopsis TaxID=2618356 RepID=UPI0039E27E02